MKKLDFKVLEIKQKHLLTMWRVVTIAPLTYKTSEACRMCKFKAV